MSAKERLQVLYAPVAEGMTRMRAILEDNVSDPSPAVGSCAASIRRQVRCSSRFRASGACACSAMEMRGPSLNGLSQASSAAVLRTSIGKKKQAFQ